jgi:hypothetical protein
MLLRKWGFPALRCNTISELHRPRDWIIIAKQEQIERLAVVKSALASQRIEGLEPDTKVIEDAEKWAHGEMTIATAVADYKARTQNEVRGR